MPATPRSTANVVTTPREVGRVTTCKYELPRVTTPNAADSRWSACVFACPTPDCGRSFTRFAQIDTNKVLIQWAEAWHRGLPRCQVGGPRSCPGREPREESPGKRALGGKLMNRRRKAALASRRVAWFRVTAATSSAALLGALGLAGTSFAAQAHPANAAQAAKAAALADDGSSSCHLGNGVKHVVQLTFDNVHFFRDNPNVPSDLQMMPNLLKFFEDNGTFLSNNHTPLIAHTADDILTTLTGLYGDRQGMPVSNGYQPYNTNGPNGSFGTSSQAGSFAYWTNPVYYSHGVPSGGDTNPSMVYSPVPPATASSPVTPDTTTPAPWVPFTRAGCDVGAFSTANVELENTGVDIPKVFGVGSPEDKQLINDPDSFKDAETADYVGVAVHCAQGSAVCADAKGVKYGQTTPTPTAVTDSLPDEPGGYTGYQALSGARYVAPQLGAGSPNLTHNGYKVTNAAGN